MDLKIQLKTLQIEYFNKKKHFFVLQISHTWIKFVTEHQILPTCSKRKDQTFHSSIKSNFSKIIFNSIIKVGFLFWVFVTNSAYGIPEILCLWIFDTNNNIIFMNTIINHDFFNCIFIYYLFLFKWCYFCLDLTSYKED